MRYASCTETSEFDAVFRAIAADVPLTMPDFDPMSEPAERGGALDTLLPADRPLTVTAMTEVFARLSGTRVIVILDEFHPRGLGRLQAVGRQLLPAKNLSDRSIRVRIAGVAANLTELIEHIPSIRRNILGLPGPMMSAEEMAEMIALGEAAGQSYLFAGRARCRRRGGAGLPRCHRGGSAGGGARDRPAAARGGGGRRRRRAPRRHADGADGRRPARSSRWRWCGRAGGGTAALAAERVLSGFRLRHAGRGRRADGAGGARRHRRRADAPAPTRRPRRIASPTTARRSTSGWRAAWRRGGPGDPITRCSIKRYRSRFASLRRRDVVGG
ncbi:hypothetical protein AB5I41_19925 [Sphingomonas sp. MMS24-JH45]